MSEHDPSLSEVSPETLHFDLQLHSALASHRGSIQEIIDPFGIQRDQLTLYPDPTNPNEQIVLSAVGNEDEGNTFQEIPAPTIAVRVSGKRNSTTNGSYRYYPRQTRLEIREQPSETDISTTPAVPGEEIIAALADKLQAATPERPKGRQNPIARLLGKFGLLGH